jgi:hypothetical protein
MVGSFGGCCVRTTSGQAAANPTVPLMRSRRRIAFPKGRDRADNAFPIARLRQDFAARENGGPCQCARQQFRVVVHVADGSFATNDA